MMKADVTAENKPACTPIRTDEHPNGGKLETDAYEYQRGVQVFVVFLHKVAIVLIGFTLEFIVEFEAGVVGGSQGVREKRW